MRLQNLWVFALSAWIGLFVQPIFAQNTPTPEPIQSLFENDTCAPPCFFGLIPGQSTSQDVVALTETSSDIYDPGITERSTFDPDTNHMILGTYYFWLQDSDEVEDPDGVAIYIGDQLVYQINVYVENSNFSIENVMDTLGPPDQVRIRQSIIGAVLRFIYVDLSISVNFDPKEECRLETINDDYQLSGLTYYAPEDVYPEGEGIFANLLLTYLPMSAEVDVPLNVFGSWLAGKREGTCMSGHATMRSAAATQTAIPQLGATAEAKQ